MLLDLIKHIYKGSGIGICSHQHAVSLCEFAYLCRLIERRISLLSSMKILAVDALIIVKLLSHTDTHCGLAESKHYSTKTCACTHTHTSLWSLWAPWHVFQLSSIFLGPLIKHRSKTETKLSSHTNTHMHSVLFFTIMWMCMIFLYAHESWFFLLISLQLACIDWK